jgi:ABC-type dipeptide/oligopeptide/nickel transport system ATPase subunit
MFAGWSAIYSQVPKTWSQIVESARRLDSIVSASSTSDLDKQMSFEQLICDRKHFRCKSLSGGQLQWLCILLYDVLEADLLLLDEPSSALSPSQSNRVYFCLQEIAERRNRIILFTSHDSNVPESISRLSLT